MALRGRVATAMLIGFLSHPGILVIDDKKQKTFQQGETKGPAES